MSFERFPLASATTTTDTPVVITPGRTVQWPEQTILRIDATPEGATGWSHTIDPKGSGASIVHFTHGKRFLGPDIVIRAWLQAGTVSVNPTPSLLIYRTVRGLVPGRQYHLSARVTPDSGGTRVRIRMGGQAAAWVTATATMTTQTVTFTATGDEEDLIVECEDNPAATTQRAGVDLAVSDITVTGLAYTQTIPPVVDDQIGLTLYDGKLTADAGWAPFIQGDITVPVPSDAVAAALDPNNGSRVRITTSSVRELVPKFTPWTVARRNIHPDPAHTGSSRAIGGGILMSCYQQMTGSNVGTTEKPNRFLLRDTGRIAQEINVKTLPSGASYGLSMTTNPPANGSTKARIYLAVEIDTFSGGGAVPTTMTVGVRVIQGSTTLLARTQDMTANGLTQLVINEVTLDTPAGPGGIRVEVYIINRAATTWTTPGTTVGVTARIGGGIGFAIADSDVAATPVVTDAISVSPGMANYLRYRKVSNTVVQETRQDAAPTLETVDSRTFDLAIAEKELDYRGGEMRLSLASDEYLLQRFAKPVDDPTPRTREHSLRSVIEYVLGESLGATPPLSGTVDGDVTARWSVDNIVSNPSFETNTDGWTAGTNTRFIQRVLNNVSWGAVGGVYGVDWFSDVAGTSYLNYDQVSIRAGAPYVLVANLFTHSGTRNARLMLRFKNAAGQTIREVFSPLAPAPDGTWTPFVIKTFAPEGSSQASFHVDHRATAGGQGMRIDGVMLYEGTEIVPYFDGSQPSPGYTASWSGAAHASTSTRTPIVAREPQSLIWAAGQTAWEFLTPLVNSRGLRLWCDAARAWHLTDPSNYTAPGRLTVTPATTVEILDRVDGERGDYADGVVITWTWTDATGAKRSRVEKAGKKGKITSLDIAAPYPGDGTAAGYLAKLQGRGVQRPLTVAGDYRANPDQPITITGPTGSKSEGEIAAVTWNLTDGLMQVEPTALTTVP